jgi:hypothetical protein
MLMDQSIAGSPRGGAAQSTMSFQVEDKKPAKVIGEQMLINAATIKSKSLNSQKDGQESENTRRLQEAL